LEICVSFVQMPKILTLAIIITVSGCATMFSGDTQQLTFDSDPSGAEVYVGGNRIGNTPLTAEIKKGNKLVQFQKEGYSESTQELADKFDLNSLWATPFGAFGMSTTATDANNGNLYEYEPKKYFVSLKKIGNYNSVAEQTGQHNTTANAYSQDVITANDKSAAKKYILQNYNEIVDELNATPGQTVNILLSMLKLGGGQRSEAIKAFQNVSSQISSESTFADIVVNYY